MTTERPTRVDWFDPPKPPEFAWYRDMFGRFTVHFANRHRTVHEAAGRRWVFGVCAKTADLDQPEIPGETDRCPECLDWARQHGHLDADPAEREAREDRRAEAVAELGEFLDNEQNTER